MNKSSLMFSYENNNQLLGQCFSIKIKKKKKAFKNKKCCKFAILLNLYKKFLAAYFTRLELIK